MADFLFVTWDGGGNLPPALGIADELRSRGHDVSFLGHAGNRAAVVARGLQFRAYESALPFSSADQNPPERMVEIFNDAGMARDMLAHLAAQHTDVVVIDCMVLPALGAARDAGLTYVALEHLFDAYYRGGWLRAPWGEVAAAQGYAPDETLAAARLNLVASLAELDPATRGPLPVNVVHTGPVVNAPKAQNLAARRPTLLVSLSTYNFPGQPEAMQTILDAAAHVPARVIVTTGPVIDAADLRVPGGFEIHDYLDHDAVMPEVTAVFGHGGHATTMRALAHDLPLAVMPQHPMLDQTMVGQAVQDAGAGRLVSREASVEQLRSVIDELLADGPHRASAARLGKLIRESRGAAAAADRIEEVL